MHVRPRERVGPRIHVADWARRVRTEWVCRFGEPRVRNWGWNRAPRLVAELSTRGSHFLSHCRIVEIWSRYAGWLGTIAARHEEDVKLSPSVSLDESGHRLAAVAGTSTCHLVQVRQSLNCGHLYVSLTHPPQSKEGVFVKGVWGPYKASNSSQSPLLVLS